MIKLGLYADENGGFHHVREIVSDGASVPHVIHRPLTQNEWIVSRQDEFEFRVDNAGNLMDRFTFMGNHEEFQSAMEDVFNDILDRAKKERAQSDSYGTLFQAYEDGGLSAAINQAEGQMRTIVHTLADMIEAKTGAPVPSPTHNLLLGLPLLANIVRADIQKNEGNGCCADKTRWLLRTYFNDLLGFSPLTDPAV